MLSSKQHAEADTKRQVFLDISGSMSVRHNNDGVTRLQRCHQVFREVFAGFGGDMVPTLVHLIGSKTGSGCSRQIVDERDSMRDKFDDVMRQWTCDAGQTYLWEYANMELLKHKNVPVQDIIIITDGGDNGSPKPFDGVQGFQALTQQWDPRNMRLQDAGDGQKEGPTIRFTLFLVGDCSDRQLLASYHDLCMATGGQFHHESFGSDESLAQRWIAPLLRPEAERRQLALEHKREYAQRLANGEAMEIQGFLPLTRNTGAQPAMSACFGSLSVMRSGQQLSPDAIQRAKDVCRGGHGVRSLRDLYSWMLAENPDTPVFDTKISQGVYPAALAAFVASNCWEPWKMHSVYAMHGEIYLARLKTAKSAMDPKSYRDHFAGASMHRANGQMHMVRCAAATGLQQLQIPCWDASRTLVDVATQAVADMRTACTLRSEKYGQPGCSEGTVKAYQAALRNLADALEIHQHVAGSGNTDKMVSRLRERATNLSLTDQKVLAACSAGESLGAQEQESVARDVRLGDSAVHVIALRQVPEASSHALCARCQTATATHHGFVCRCLCLCADCVEAQGSRILECPNCEEFTEFVRA